MTSICKGGKCTSIRYIIISPIRNEEKHIERTIQSVSCQTIKPMKWIIVDDGSSDKTNAIVSAYMKCQQWIALLTLRDRGYYDLDGGGDIRAFLKGYEVIKDSEYDYLVKLDGDVSFNEHYFEDLFKAFESNRKLGIASGACYHFIANRLILERAYKYHARGAGRVYKRQCWVEIGGAIESVGWDAVDVYKARMLGWDTYNFETIRMTHHVRTGAKGGIIHDFMRGGRIGYLIGYHPIFFFLSVIRQVCRRPFIVGSVAYLSGYLGAIARNEKRIVDKALMSYVRKEQIDRIRKSLVGVTKRPGQAF